MGAVDLTIKGSNCKKMVTDMTLDREGFFIPQPPQQLDPRRIKSAAAPRKQEPNFGRKLLLTGNSPMIRAKSAAVTIARKPEINRKVEKENHVRIPTPTKRPQQGWTHHAEKRKDKASDLTDQSRPKQRLTVCEVMAKMRAKSPESELLAPPTSPKGRSVLVGKRFVSDHHHQKPVSDVEKDPVTGPTNGYLSYQRRRQLSYLQEDMTVTGQPSDRVIDIPCGGERGGTTEEQMGSPPHHGASRRPSPGQPILKGDVYRSVYLKDYRDYSTARFKAHREAQCPIPCGVDRPKPDNSYVRYTPNTYRFREPEPRNPSCWDREQPRVPFNNTKVVTTRRPSQSIYVGGR